LLWLSLRGIGFLGTINQVFGRRHQDAQANIFYRLAGRSSRGAAASPPGGESGDEMRAIVCSSLMALTITTAGARAEGCTRDHELYKIVPKYRAIMLDGGDIKRVMFVDWQDERLKTWKPGHNITFCPDEDKMINTTINSVATLVSQFATTTCKTLLISNQIDRLLQAAWDRASSSDPSDPSLFVDEAKSSLGWYYEVCTDHRGGLFDDSDLRHFLLFAPSLTRINMAIEDPANASTYKTRAAQYKKWFDALYEIERKLSWAWRIWKWLTGPN
jgi:hypothetical protein